MFSAMLGSTVDTGSCASLRRLRKNILQLPGAKAVRVRRHDPPQRVCARILCVLCLFFVFVPRQHVVKVTLREARRCGQSSVARRLCAERSGLLHPFRCNVVAVGAGGGSLCSLVLQRNEARALREALRRSATFLESWF